MKVLPPSATGIVLVPDEAGKPALGPTGFSPLPARSSKHRSINQNTIKRQGPSPPEWSSGESSPGNLSDDVRPLAPTSGKLGNAISWAQPDTSCTNKPSPSGQPPPSMSEPSGSSDYPRDRTNDLYGHDKDVDAGYAWVILAVMFVINASTYGTARAYGLIFEKLAREEELSRSEAALPFTIMGAVENIGGPLTVYLMERTGSWRITVFLGCSLVTVSHLAAAFFSSQIGQILTLGLAAGLGLSQISISFFQINNAYFKRYRSRAFGLGLTGAALGTLYISPICQFMLNRFNTSYCYMVLSAILLPTVPLSLLLKPKQLHDQQALMRAQRIKTISAELARQRLNNNTARNNNQLNEKPPREACPTGGQPRRPAQLTTWQRIKLVLTNPIFHLIWPTQLLFCWLNFVFGMIIVDFAKDRGMGSDQATKLITVWAFGQLIGRIVLGAVVDMKFASYRTFTVICFAAISVSTYLIDNMRAYDQDSQDQIMSGLVLVLSTFISNLYILFNGLVERYSEKPLCSLSIGISSFIGSFFLLPRASVIGYYRDTIGHYGPMFSMSTLITLMAALVWLIVPSACSEIHRTFSQRLSVYAEFSRRLSTQRAQAIARDEAAAMQATLAAGNLPITKEEQNNSSSSETLAKG